MLKIYVPLLALCLCLPFPAPAQTPERNLKECIVDIQKRLIEEPLWSELRQNSPEYLEAYLSGFLSGYRTHTLFSLKPSLDQMFIVSQALDVQNLLRRTDDVHTQLIALPDLSDTRFADLDLSRIRVWEAISLALYDTYVEAHDAEILPRNMEDEEKSKFLQELLRRVRTSQVTP